MEQMILVAIKGQRTQIVAGPLPVGIIQAKKKLLAKEIQWKGYTFQVRTEDGYKAVKIYVKKPKELTYEQKKALVTKC